MYILLNYKANGSTVFFCQYDQYDLNFLVVLKNYSGSIKKRLSPHSKVYLKKSKFLIFLGPSNQIIQISSKFHRIYTNLRCCKGPNFENQKLYFQAKFIFDFYLNSKQAIIFIQGMKIRFKLVCLWRWSKKRSKMSEYLLCSNGIFSNF